MVLIQNAYCVMRIKVLVIFCLLQRLLLKIKQGLLLNSRDKYMMKYYYHHLIKNGRLHLVLLGLIMSYPTYGEGDDQKQSGGEKDNEKDITNAIFSIRSGQCQDYAGRYYSEVRDLQREVAFSGVITILVDEGFCFIKSNNIPNHDFNDETAHFATPVKVQEPAYRVTQTPKKSAVTTSVSMSITNAVMLNGVAVDLYSAGCYGVGDEPLGREKRGCNDTNNPWRYDAMVKENRFGTDKHHAHVQPNGAYHYHGNPMAMFLSSCDTQLKPSAVIGFAADGFPVFGSCILDPQTGKIRKVTSSFVLKNNGGKRQSIASYQTPKAGEGFVVSDNYNGQFIGDSEYQAGAGDLDECNGMTVNGQYGYYVTDSYPWILDCYKGRVDASFRKQGPRLKNRMHGH